MEPLSYMRSVVNRNVVLRRVHIYIYIYIYIYIDAPCLNMGLTSLRNEASLQPWKPVTVISPLFYTFSEGRGVMKCSSVVIGKMGLA
jgi:hypothetical protein